MIAVLGVTSDAEWEQLVDTYRVDLQVPDGVASGTAAVQLTAAWIAGPPVNVPVQKGYPARASSKPGPVETGLGVELREIAR
jgi:hypothetical protein